MDISTLKYMQDRVSRGERIQSTIQALKKGIKLLEKYPGLKIVVIPGDPFSDSQPIFSELKEAFLHKRLSPLIISEINKIIAELETEFAAL